MQTTKERIEKAIAHLKGEQIVSANQEIIDLMRVNKSSFSQAINGNEKYLTEGFVLKFCAAYPIFNKNWLWEGEGEMLKGERAIAETLESGSSFVQGKIIPLFDAAAIGGNNYGMDMTPARQIEMIQIGGFLRESESALRVYGNSMTPNYPPGCIVGTRPWNERFIEPGRVYVVETHENRFLKRLYYNNDKSSYRCLSDNTMIHETGPAKGEYCYPEFEIPLEDVFKMHKVIGVIKRSTI